MAMAAMDGMGIGSASLRGSLVDMKDLLERYAEDAKIDLESGESTNTCKAAWNDNQKLIDAYHWSGLSADVFRADLYGKLQGYLVGMFELLDKAYPKQLKSIEGVARILSDIDMLKIRKQSAIETPVVF